MEISEVEEDEEQWPFSERVYVLTTASLTEVDGWMRSLYPDDIGTGWAFGKPPAAPDLHPGVNVYSVWWD